jgi:hypothetical protein
VTVDSTRATPAERYLRLGLQLGRCVEGIVDAYYGPAELRAAVESEPPVDPSRLAADADALFGELEDGWLRDQVAGLRTYAGVLAGEATGYADEVEGCYGVRPERTDESVFAAAHEELDGLLPGAGSLVERLERWESSTRVPPERVEHAMAAIIELARAQTRELIELPEGEGVELELVHDVAWLGFCEYLGGFRSRIMVNADLPRSVFELLVLAMHETYPGHHTDSATKERVLVRGRGLVEETILLVPTPQSLVAEGIATLAPGILLEGGGGGEFAALVHDLGIDFDLEHTLAVDLAREPCRWAQVNAALMLYERDATDAEAQAYLERWAVVEPELAAHLIRFLREPTSRSYILNYAAGRKLGHAYVDGDPARFCRLLTERIRVRDLLAAA